MILSMLLFFPLLYIIKIRLYFYDGHIVTAPSLINISGINQKIENRTMRTIKLKYPR